MDNLTKEQRRKNMRAIKSRSILEDRVTKKLWKKGLRFRKNDKTLMGKPDISIKKYKVVIFIDSCFWHVCPEHINLPETNQEYWIKKLNGNQERDLEVANYYKLKQWHIKRVWEHDLKNNFDNTIDEIYDFIIEAKDKCKKNIK
ncbi:very short patch repair endonuclease [Bacillus benzoevorans]|uniref:Very short patch repair endonuclease n=1 Tax=Bacillus benzoevorans TaxID=1456 RepID=A0A7X0LX46_9BACI|nr:very short patch repair endonuclease [Bacillus benzoevorans]MBB6447791.1 DNA mismatch endonuclease (patch repair protein) [Bacillus benzoevorans]